MKSKLVIFLFTILTIYVVFDQQVYKRILSWDKTGYYVYLPATFIYHDLGKVTFYNEFDSVYHSSSYKWYGLTLFENTQRRLNKYPIGVACMEMPSFLVAYAYVTITNQPMFYGFNDAFQLSVFLASASWMIIGLFFLRKLLLEYFTDSVVAISLTLVLIGTNLYCYCTYEVGMSHSFSWAMFSIFFCSVDAWYKKHLRKDLILIGLSFGFIAIIRPSNILVFLIPLLWMITSKNEFHNRIKLLKKQRINILLSAVCSFSIIFIQLAYWKYTTGRWFIDSYKGEYFDFLHPHIIEGLFSYDKGWFIYTPMSILFVLGCYFLWKNNKGAFYPIVIYFILNIYVVFSWSFWQYGGGFGARALIESYSILIFPLAYFISIILSKKKYVSMLFFLLFIGFIYTNFLQTYQYREGYLPALGISKADYWHLWGIN